MRHYCTLFDRNYLAKGLAMYESLKRHATEEFMFFVLVLDSETADVLSRSKPVQWWPGHIHNDPDIWAFLAEDFDTFGWPNPSREIRKKYNWREYCWALASQFANYMIVTQRFDEITYLDADLFFFSDPEPIFQEIGDRSIGIIEHRLIPSKRHLEVNGRFNVGLVHFKGTEVGRACLARWAAQVRERCDASTCGDQKYLDEWPERYGDEVCIVQNIGANVAPWNVGNYRVDTLHVYDSVLSANEIMDVYHSAPMPTVDGRPIIFYHFHEYQHGKRLTNYELRSEDIELIYKPYIKAIDDAQVKIASIQQSTAI